MKLRNAGFTLIELVVLIVILAILAVTAVPRFLNVQREARIVALEGMAAAIKEVNNLVYSRAAIEGKELDVVPIIELFPEYSCTGNASNPGLSCAGHIQGEPDLSANGNGLIVYGEMRSDIETLSYFIDGLPAFHEWEMVPHSGDGNGDPNTGVAYSDGWYMDFNRNNAAIRIYPSGGDFMDQGADTVAKGCVLDYRKVVANEAYKNKAVITVTTRDC